MLLLCLMKSRGLKGPTNLGHGHSRRVSHHARAQILLPDWPKIQNGVPQPQH